MSNSHPREPSRARRELAALASALVVHGLVLVVVTQSSVRRVFPPQAHVPIVVEFRRPTPPSDVPAQVEEPALAPSAPTPKKKSPPPSSTEPERVPIPVVAEPPASSPSAPPSPPPPTTTPPATAPPATSPPATSPPRGESLLRLPPHEGAIGRVLGTGGTLGPSVAGLEGALEVRVEGPLSDAARAARGAKRMLETDLADDAVTAGLADDYFRELRGHVETSWRPATRQLNDGGQSVTQVGMSKAFIDDRSAWDEMWRAYLDLAKMYANGQRPSLEPARIGRLRELMRSRKGMFRFHAISEVVLTQAPDGKVLTIELPLPSGHPGIDEGVRDAFTTAVAAMVDPPPSRVHQGRTFTSTWRMRATWTMIPPTAFLMGTGFDITSKGLQVDIPFDIQLKTNVMLLRTDAHARGAIDGVAEP